MKIGVQSAVKIPRAIEKSLVIKPSASISLFRFLLLISLIMFECICLGNFNFFFLHLINP